jgi:hypothetical protein
VNGILRSVCTLPTSCCGIDQLPPAGIPHHVNRFLCEFSDSVNCVHSPADSETTNLRSNLTSCCPRWSGDASSPRLICCFQLLHTYIWDLRFCSVRTRRGFVGQAGRGGAASVAIQPRATVQCMPSICIDGTCSRPPNSTAPILSSKTRQRSLIMNTGHFEILNPAIASRRISATAMI